MNAQSRKVEPMAQAACSVNLDTMCFDDPAFQRWLFTRNVRAVATGETVAGGWPEYLYVGRYIDLITMIREWWNSGDDEDGDGEDVKHLISTIECD